MSRAARTLAGCSVSRLDRPHPQLPHGLAFVPRKSSSARCMVCRSAPAFDGHRLEKVSVSASLRPLPVNHNRDHLVRIPVCPVRCKLRRPPPCRLSRRRPRSEDCLVGRRQQVDAGEDLPCASPSAGRAMPAHVPASIAEDSVPRCTDRQRVCTSVVGLLGLDLRRPRQDRLCDRRRASRQGSRNVSFVCAESAPASPALAPPGPYGCWRGEQLPPPPPSRCGPARASPAARRSGTPPSFTPSA